MKVRLKSTVEYNKEQALLTKVVEEGDSALKRVLKSKVTAEHLTDLDYREQYVWVVRKFQTAGRVPSMPLFLAEFPDFEPVHVRDNLSLVLDAIREKKTYNDIQAVLTKVNTESKSNVAEALKLLKSETGDLSTRHSDSERIDVTKMGADIKRDYLLNKQMKGMLGVPYIWPRVNKATRGKRKGQLVGLYGATGTMKTWVAIADAEHSHTKHGQVPLFITREMLAEEILERWAVLRAKVSYEAYQDGALTEEEERRLFKMLRRIKDDPPFHITTITGYGSAALAEIRATIQETGADCTYVDGAYFYAEDGDYKSFMTVTNGLKDIALDLRTVVVATNQSNTKKSSDAIGDTTDVGYGQSFPQACDVLIRTWCSKENFDNNELVLKSKKVRKGRPFAVTINAKPGGDFTQKFSMEDEEALSDSVGDDDNPIEE